MYVKISKIISKTIEISVAVLIITVTISMSRDLIERTREWNRIPTHTHTTKEGKRGNFIIKSVLKTTYFLLNFSVSFLANMYLKSLGGGCRFVVLPENLDHMDIITLTCWDYLSH